MECIPEWLRRFSIKKSAAGQIFCATKCAASKTYQTKCATGRIFWLSPHGYSVLLMQYVIYFPRITAQNLLVNWLRQGWVFSKQTCVFSATQFTRYFIEFVVVETKQIVSSNSNVILTRQTCGQRSGMAAGGKRQALAFYFSIQIFYFFLMSKCRGESDSCLCMTSVLAERMPMRSADFQFLNVFGRIVRIRHCALIFSVQVPKSCTDIDPTLLYSLTLGTCSKFVWKKYNAIARRLLTAAMPKRWPQVCRVKITFESLLKICFVSISTKSMKYLVNWIPLNTHVCFENTQPCLNSWIH